MATRTSQGSALLVVAYVFSWLSGIVLYIAAGGKDSRLRFHALQSLALGIVSVVLIDVLGFVPFANDAGVVVWLCGIYIGWIAYNDNRDIVVPLLGKYARQYSGHSR